jgi:ankyrin repeat protein
MFILFPGSTCLHDAANYGFDEIVKMLIDKEADVEMCDLPTYIQRCKSCHLPTYMYIQRCKSCDLPLTYKGVNPVIYQLTCKGENPVIYQLTYYGFDEIVKMLIDREADVEMIDKAGFTPLHVSW